MISLTHHQQNREGIMPKKGTTGQKLPKGYVPPHLRGTETVEKHKVIKGKVAWKKSLSERADETKAALKAKKEEASYKKKAREESLKELGHVVKTKPKLLKHLKVKTKDLIELDFTREELISQDFLLGDRFVTYYHDMAQRMESKQFLEHFEKLRADAHKAGNYALSSTASVGVSIMKENGVKGTSGSKIEAITELTTFITKMKVSKFKEDLQERVWRLGTEHDVKGIVDILKAKASSREVKFVRPAIEKTLEAAQIADMKALQIAVFNSGLGHDKDLHFINAVLERSLDTKEKEIKSLIISYFDPEDVDLKALDDLAEEHDKDFVMSVLYEVLEAIEGLELSELKAQAKEQGLEHLLEMLRAEDYDMVEHLIDAEDFEAVEEFLTQSNINSEVVEVLLRELNVGFVTKALENCQSQGLEQVSALLSAHLEAKKLEIEKCFNLEYPNLYILENLLISDASIESLLSEVLSTLTTESLHELSAQSMVATKFSFSKIVASVIAERQESIMDPEDAFDPEDGAFVLADLASSDLPFGKGIFRAGRDGSTKSLGDKSDGGDSAISGCSALSDMGSAPSSPSRTERQSQCLDDFEYDFAPGSPVDLAGKDPGTFDFGGIVDAVA